MNLIPENSQKTGNYFCTWDSQCDHMYTWKERPADRSARDAMNEEFLFGQNGLLNSFEGSRQDLIVVIDDGWDVPYGATDDRLFGSLELDADRFPSFSELNPPERLKALSNRIKSMGYRGLGLWVPSQSPSLAEGNEIITTLDEERLYWEERAKWCAEAEILYWKVDWGLHMNDPQYRKMMTECARKYAPKLKVEHAYVGHPLFEEDDYEIPCERLQYLQNILPASDFLRTYDVCHELKYASTIERTSICFIAAHECKANAILNIEDTGLIGAALGCSIGVMRHDLEKKRKYVTLPPRLVSETVAALRWQRIAPPFAAGKGSLEISEERLKDVWHCPEREPGLWPDVPEGNYYVTAPASIARNMPLPDVYAEGEKPFVLCSIHPDNGALCIAATPRTFVEGIDLTPLAEVKVKADSPEKSIGIFGNFKSLSIEFDSSLVNFRVFAQNMLSDSADDVTDNVSISGNTLIIPHELLTRLGEVNGGKNVIPAVVMRLLK